MSSLYSLISDHVLKQLHRFPELPSSLKYERLANEEAESQEIQPSANKEAESQEIQPPTKYSYKIYVSVLCSVLVLLLCFQGTIDVQFCLRHSKHLLT